METKLDVWQTTMDRCYDRWREGGDLYGMTYPDFVGSLDDDSRFLVVLGNLRYQVGNGGLVQWHDNGYSSCIEDISDALRAVATDDALALGVVIDEVNDVLDYYDGVADDITRAMRQGDFPMLSQMSSDIVEFVGSRLRGELEELSERCVQLLVDDDAQLAIDIEAWASRPPETMDVSGG